MLKIIQLFLITLMLIPLQQLAQEKPNQLKKVVIDAGHGGKDPGALIGKVKEKDIVLDVALRTGELIKAQFPQVEVLYTRDNDVFVPLAERAEIANKSKADLFISIHVNYFKSEHIYGSETYILGNHRTEENLKVAQMENSVILLEDDYTTRYEGFDPNSAESYIMFELIQNEFLEQSRFFADQVQQSFISTAQRKSRGVRQAGFLVLRRTSMPSVLVELGFISNKNELQFLISNKGRQQMAQSIADAFARYKMRVDARSGVLLSNTQETSTASQAPHAVEPVQQQVNTQPILSEQPLEPASTNNSDLLSHTQNGTWYSIQIMASRTRLNPDHPVFKSNDYVYVYNEDDWFKYCKGLTRQLDEAKKIQQKLKQEHGGAILIRFVNGKKDKVVSY